ncbi:type II toxin-antitoxin system RelE/ParE family toxin [Janthinobacterium aquaticum]|uniref:type II toxin-antitoxin system RelE/ParE family toxin n=1 Tax=Janthinobacterium sp. FT58W TaxID=2654254 RepID=UPI00126481E1|nr:type II toxin-antitoxin system RelE/ParE family toxin [Janthinobacterium sp. FT58W]KAB8045021.1 type II toxin-antitoxin system RelE/ParE family toxin [Janthinobacterium sp. FT58W]
MNQKRVFKTKTFARWARKVLNDELLCKAASEIERGEFEADLGQGVCKKRIALPGQGKSGSARSLVAKQHASAIFFLAGREKSDPGKDFSSKEEEAAKLVGKALQGATAAKLDAMKMDGLLTEICGDCHEQQNYGR